MTQSMKDLLMGLGFKPAPQPAASKPERKDTPRPRAAAPMPQGRRPERPSPQARPSHRDRSPQAQRDGHRPQPQRSREEIDLAKAYAIRAQKEKDERIEAERVKQEAARIKREAKAKIAELLKDKSLNDASAELTRHFDYNGKIRRVHVNEAQLKALNGGKLGVVQLDGRYLLVDASLAREVHALLPSLLALLIDPNALSADDPYADPKYVVPDDLAW